MILTSEAKTAEKATDEKEGEEPHVGEGHKAHFPRYAGIMRRTGWWRGETPQMNERGSRRGGWKALPSTAILEAPLFFTLGQPSFKLLCINDKK